MAQENIPEQTAIGAIDEMVKTRVSGMKKFIPGRVINFEAESGPRADVQPLIKYHRRSEEDPSILETYMPPPIYDCPVTYPMGGGTTFTFPLEEGDRVNLFFADKSVDEWLLSDEEENEPGDARSHRFQNAVVQPGLRSFANALAGDRINEDTATLAVEDGQQVHLGSGSLADDRFVAIASLVESELSDIWNALNSHKHNVPGIVSGNSSTTTDASGTSGSAGQVDSNKVKAD